MKMDQLYRRFRGTVRFTAEGGHALADARSARR